MPSSTGEKSTSRRPPNLQAGVGPKSTSERHERPRGAVGDGRRAARRDPARFGRVDRYLRASWTCCASSDSWSSWYQTPENMQTISVPGVPNPAGTVPKASSESLEAQDGARAPSKKLGVQERQYSVADMRQMMRLHLTGQARSARLAAEQVGIPTATTALKRFLGVVYDKTELVRAYFAFKSVENSYCRRYSTQR